MPSTKELLTGYCLCDNLRARKEKVIRYENHVSKDRESSVVSGLCACQSCDFISICALAGSQLVPELAHIAVGKWLRRLLSFLVSWLPSVVQSP